MKELLAFTSERLENPTLTHQSDSLPRLAFVYSRGDALLEMFLSVSNMKMPLLQAWQECSLMCVSKWAKGIAEKIAYSIEGGSSLSEAISRHPDVFDRLSIIAVQLGERGSGVQQCLSRYFRLQAQREENRIGPRPNFTSPYTRDFALISGSLMEMGAHPLDAFQAAAHNQPRRFKKAVESAVELIKEGHDFDNAFDPEHTKGIFRFKFDKLFLNTLRAAEGTSKIGQLLVDFGSRNWTLLKV